MKKRAVKVLFLCGISLILASSGVANAEKIRFIGLDDNGEQITKTLSKKIFKKRLSTVVSLLQEEVIQALEESESKSKALHLSDWEVRKFLVGVSLSASLGIGSAIKGTIKPGFYLIFKK